MGPVVVIKREALSVRRTEIADADAEVSRLEKARKQTQEQLQRLYDRAVEKAGEESAAIFEAYMLMLEDEEYLEAVRSLISSQRMNAEYAVEMTGDRVFKRFARMEDEYVRARAADVRDISDRLIRNLTGCQELNFDMFDEMQPSVVVAEELKPSETVQMDRKKILAFVTVRGSASSHTAILARMMNIPALVGVPMDLGKIHGGMTAVVDGFQGEVIFDPTAEVRRRAEDRIREEEEKLRRLQELKGKENITLDGHRIEVYANISGVGDVEAVLENDAGGIGLFRSEFLYLGRGDFPTEEEQFQAYQQVVQAMGGRRVVIRTLDIGADKQVDYFHLGKEENPALGYRAIRICLKQPEIFKVQLRALLRAAWYGKLSILYPMIISVKEVERIYALVEETRAELEMEQIPYRMPEQGIMIETPAAVMISEELAEMVDFFSIGTNDLTQYTLAVDRQNERLEDFYDPHHKAVLKMIQMTVEHAHQAGKWAGICGELAADPELTETFIRMGVDELSVAPSMVLQIRKAVREASVGKAVSILKQWRE